MVVLRTIQINRNRNVKDVASLIFLTTEQEGHFVCTAAAAHPSDIDSQ